MRRIVIGIITTIVVLALFLVLCTFRARKYEVVLLDRFGTIITNPSPIAYNWYLCFPTDKVVRLDTRLHVYPSGLDELTMNGETIAVRTFAAWHITNATAFYRKFSGSDTDAQGFIHTEVVGKTREVLASRKFDEIFNAGAPATEPGAATEAVAGAASQPAGGVVHTQEIENEITKRVNADLAAYGMKATEIGFSRFAFATYASGKIYDRMSAERQRLAQRFIDEGNTQATQIRAEGSAQAVVIVGQAKRQAEEIKAQAENEALNIIADMQQKPYAKDLYEFWRSLELFKAAITKNTVLILTANDSIMKGGFGTPALLPPPATMPQP
jgi:membrane protease subunit HflC